MRGRDSSRLKAAECRRWPSSRCGWPQGECLPVELQRFITGAAMSPEQLRTPEWQAGFHSRILEAAYGATKTPMEEADFERVMEYLAGRNAVAQRPHAVVDHHASPGNSARIVERHCPRTAGHGYERHAGGDGRRASGC